MRDIGILIPTRGRPHKIADVHTAWFQTISGNTLTDAIIVLDEDDETVYPRLDGFRYEIVPPGDRRGIVHPLNFAAKRLCGEYRFLGMIGDDHVPLTKDWDVCFLNKLTQEAPYSMVYANDLFQGANLASMIVMDSRYILKLGYMTHPDLTHLFSDNFWMHMGRLKKNIHYMHDVIFEHQHYCNGKSPIDALYAILNSQEYYGMDNEIFNRLIADKDIEESIRDLD